MKWPWPYTWNLGEWLEARRLERVAEERRRVNEWMDERFRVVFGQKIVKAVADTIHDHITDVVRERCEAVEYGTVRRAVSSELRRAVSEELRTEEGTHMLATVVRLITAETIAEAVKRAIVVRPTDV